MLHGVTTHKTTIWNLVHDVMPTLHESQNTLPKFSKVWLAHHVQNTKYMYN
jgi:hypothetical protein